MKEIELDPVSADSSTDHDKRKHNIPPTTNRFPTQMFCSTWSSKESNSCRHQQHWRHNTESLSQFDSALGWLWNPSPPKKARECSLKNMSHIFLCKVNMVNLPQLIPQILNVPMDVWSIFKKSRSSNWWIPYVFLTCSIASMCRRPMSNQRRESQRWK